ncbi:hypothetical protein ACIBTP_34425 [Streptomyces avidinii]|uniref:hypothetical protein n=1 Tax=Streptomyces avidinii TaxID=1895 RepID=UPI0037BDF759
MRSASPLMVPEAARHGLVNQLTGEDKALDGALALAERIRADSPQVARATRGLDDHAAFIAQDPLTAPVFRTDTATEGARAFCEKRTPDWAA